MNLRPMLFQAALAAALALGAVLPAQAADAHKPVKVFILAGQSNMEGKAKMSLLEYQATAEKTRAEFAHLKKDGKWIVRDDVWIKFLDRKGKLTVGFGSEGCIGPELEFGNVMGNHFQEQVLLIKTAWGGRSLYRDFRSPSAGLPADEVLQKMLTEARKRKPEATLDEIKGAFGASYRSFRADHLHLPSLRSMRLTLEQAGFEPVALEGHPAEPASNRMHAPLRPRFARRIVDAHAGTAKPHRGRSDLADIGVLGMQHDKQRAAEPDLLAVGHAAILCGGRRAHDAHALLRHAQGLDDIALGELRVRDDQRGMTHRALDQTAVELRGG